MAKSGKVKKKQPVRRLNATQVVIIVISVIVVLSFTLSLIAR